MELLTFLREGIILLTSADSLEEQFKRNNKNSDELSLFMHMNQYNEDVKKLL